jgi:hypothetical protein
MTNITADFLSEDYGHMNENSSSDLLDITHDDVDYCMRVCGIGNDAYFEWVDDDGNPIGDMFYSIKSYDDAIDKFLKLLEQN